jgi:hypothetical protein
MKNQILLTAVLCENIFHKGGSFSGGKASQKADSIAELRRWRAAANFLMEGNK